MWNKKRGAYSILHLHTFSCSWVHFDEVTEVFGTLNKKANKNIISKNGIKSTKYFEGYMCSRWILRLGFERNQYQSMPFI